MTALDGHFRCNIHNVTLPADQYGKHTDEEHGGSPPTVTLVPAPPDRCYLCMVSACQEEV